MIPKSHGIWNMKETRIICYVLYEDVICFVQYDIYNYACYSHVMTFLTQYGKFTNFPNLNLASLLTWLPKIMSLVKRCSFSCMSLVCSCIYPYLVQVCTNPIHLYYFRCRHRWAIEIQVHCCSYPDVAFIWSLVGPHAFEDVTVLHSNVVLELS